MALILCITCGKRVSDKAEYCPHCNAAVTSKDAEATLRSREHQRWKRGQRAQYLGFGAISAFLVGSILYWMGRAEPASVQTRLGIFLLATGFIAYAVLRIYQIVNKRK